MKTGKLAIRPWLVCQYNENTLVDLLSSVPVEGGRGIQKMPKKETFTSRFERTKEGRVPKKFGETSFMDGPLGNFKVQVF